MDALHVDSLARALRDAETRRGLLRSLATLPILGGFLDLFDPDEIEAHGRRRRRKKRHKHGKGRRRAGKKCQPNSRAKTCAGKCGSVRNNCKKRVDCGTCACASNGDCGAGFLCLENGSCQACTVTCAGAPEACGTALQTALDAGGTVYVCPGTYQGGFTIATAVNIIGAGEGEDDASNTILNGNDTVRVVQIEPDTGAVELARLRITGGSNPTGHGGINHEGTTLRMTDCTVSGNGAGGISSDTDTTLELTRCTLTGNASGGGGGAISSAATLTLTDCLIEGNSAPFGAGIATFGAATLAGTTVVRGNTATIVGGGIIVGDGSLTIAETCQITENSPGGIFLQSLTAPVTLQGADPSPIVVNNCPENCVGNPVPKCAPPGTCPP